MEPFRSELTRAKKAYRAATSPLFADSAPEQNTDAARERGRGQGVWPAAPQTQRTAAPMEEPDKTENHFTPAKVLVNSLSGSVNIQKISEDCEREARRYERR